MAAGDDGEKAPESDQIADIGDGADIAFEVGLKIGSEPKVTRIWMSERFGKPAMEQVNFLGFAEAQRQELKNRGAPRHRLGDAAHQRSFLRACEQPLAHALRVRVNDSADVVQEIGRVLDFIEDDRRAKFFEEGARIALDAAANIGIFEEYILGAREEMAQDGCFSCAARSGENDAGEAFGGLQEDGGKFSFDVPHMRIINY